MNGLLGRNSWAHALSGAPLPAAATGWLPAGPLTSRAALAPHVSVSAPGVSFDGPLSAATVLDPTELAMGPPSAATLRRPRALVTEACSKEVSSACLRLRLGGAGAAGALPEEVAPVPASAGSPAPSLS